MAIAQITVEAVWAVVLTLLQWEVTRIVVGVAVSLWVVGAIFDFLDDHGMAGQLRSDAAKGRADRASIAQTLQDLEDAEFHKMYGGGS